jgi:hypothetical protein
VDPSQHGRPASGIWLAVFATLLTAISLILTFMPLVDCPTRGAFRDGTLEYEGKVIDRPHVQLWEAGGVTNIITPCPRCKGSARVTLVNKWFGKDIQPSAAR